MKGLYIYIYIYIYVYLRIYIYNIVKKNERVAIIVTRTIYVYII